VAPAGAPARVDLLDDVSDTATVIQVRAHDRPGLVYDVCTALAASGADVRSAHVSTLGAECVDVFYLTDAEGNPLTADRTTPLLTSLLTHLT
jgi:[protein-PII] uridylyltransferase